MGNLNGAGKYIYAILALAGVLALLAVVQIVGRANGMSAADLLPITGTMLAVGGFLNAVGALLVGHLHSKANKNGGGNASG